jgi:hypothetical protein
MAAVEQVISTLVTLVVLAASKAEVQSKPGTNSWI